MQPRPSHAPVTSGRRIAISAGSLAVSLGALDTYVVVTIISDIMLDVGIGINQIQRVTPIITVVPAGIHRGDAAAGPGIRPVRPKTVAAVPALPVSPLAQ